MFKKLFEKFKKNEKVVVPVSTEELYEENNVWHIGPFPPKDKKKLWIDSNTQYGGLKIFVAGEWVPVIIHNPDKHCLDVYDYVDIMSRTHG